MRFNEGIASPPALDLNGPGYVAYELLLRPPEQEADHMPYPDIPDIGLRLGERAVDIFGSRVRSSRRDTRLSAVVDAIYEIVPGSMPEGQADIPALRARQNIDRFLFSRVSLPGDVEMRREQIVNFDFIRERLTKTLAETNHPIFQAIRSLSDINQARIDANSDVFKLEKDPVLSQADFDDTADDILKATQGQEITRLTESAITYGRSIAKADLVRARLLAQRQS